MVEIVRGPSDDPTKDIEFLFGKPFTKQLAEGLQSVSNEMRSVRELIDPQFPTTMTEIGLMSMVVLTR